MLDYCDSPFWSADEETEIKFGNNINLNDLNLSERTKTRLKSIMKLYHSKLNPVYGTLPSLWSGRMNVFFQMFLKQVYSALEKELADEFEIQNFEQKLMNQELNVEEIDKRLNEFVMNPTEYADKNRINYKSKETFEEKIRLAKQEADKLEFEWTTM